MKNSTKCVLVVSDLHCGSIFGMMPPGFIGKAGAVINQNPGQKYLWECWEHLAARVKETPIAAVVVNGDVIDGRQEAQRGTEMALPLQGDQVRAAEVCLKHLKESTGAAEWFFTQGTEYHDHKAGEAVEGVAEALGARQYRGAGTGEYSREVLDLEIEGVVINVAHGISCSGGLYRTTAPDREAVWSALAGKEGKLPKADALIRSHAHYFTHVEHPTKHAVVCPCWQLQTRFMRKNSVYRMVPDIGALFIWVDGEAKARREDPIVVKKLLFDLPKIGTTRL
jgi:hypothetical protein